MITLSYELLGVMMIAPMMLGAVMTYIIYSCDGESKRKQINWLYKDIKNNEKNYNELFNENLHFQERIKELEEEYSNLFEAWKKELSEGYNKQAIIESKDKQIKEPEDNVAREFELRNKIEHKKGTNTVQYRNIEALRNRFKAIKKGEVYSGKQVIKNGIKMYSIKVNGATYILKRSNFKIKK